MPDISTRRTDQPGRSMSPERYQALLDKLGIVQQQAGVSMGYTARAGQNWKVTGPPPAVCILLNLLDFLDIDLKELDHIMREHATRPVKPRQRRLT